MANTGGNKLDHWIRIQETALMVVGMMISAFAKAGQVLEDALYSQRALQAIQFVQRELYHIDSSAAAISSRLLRSCYVDSGTAEIARRFDPF